MNLQEYHLGSDIPQLCGAISPGKHCPLFGVCSVLRYVDHVSVIYLGTNDCVYFAQKQYLTTSIDHPSQARVIAAQLTDSDLVFGIGKQLKKLIQEEYEENHPTAIYVVTSCSIEVISEDIEGVTKLLNKQMPCKVKLIKTENFKTLSYYRGIELTLEALVDGVQPLPKKEKSFAILGARFAGAESCEPVKILVENGYTIQSNMPFQCTEQDIQTISQVEFTIVVDGTGIETAQRLKKEFDIDYFLFDCKFDTEKITKTYQALSAKTGIPLENFIKKHMDEIEKKKTEAKEKLTGKTFFYSNIVLYPFEGVKFMTELGMVPQCIFIGTAIDREDRYLEQLKKTCNPEVIANANSASVISKMEEYHPDYFMGGTINAQELISRNVIQSGFPVMPIQCGFQYITQAINKLLGM